VGSVFRVYLPLDAAAAPQKTGVLIRTPKIAGKGTVLVVDDERSLLKAVSQAVKCMGFTPLEASDGMEAVEVFQRHRQEIRLVICDLTMPRMGGWEALAEMRKLAPGIPVILCSGYSEVQAMAGNHVEQPQAFLSKPYEFETLSDTVAKVLQAKNS
jgi:DNA-binding NtrC family response regulator